VAGGGTCAAAVALFFIYFNDFSYHGISSEIYFS